MLSKTLGDTGMVYYDTARMITDLRMILESIPNLWERNFILSMQDNGIVSMPQYNKLLDLYNKYIVVPAGPSQNLRNYNY